jgi:hypothetical protein
MQKPGRITSLLYYTTDNYDSVAKVTQKGETSGSEREAEVIRVTGKK